jgi:hypothetical protein
MLNMRKMIDLVCLKIRVIFGKNNHEKTATDFKTENLTNVWRLNYLQPLHVETVKKINSRNNVRTFAANIHERKK